MAKSGEKIKVPIFIRRKGADAFRPALAAGGSLMAYKCLSLCRFRGFTAGFCKNFVQRFQKFKMRFQGKAKNFDLFRMRKKFRVQVERNFPTLSHERFSIVEPVVQFEKLLGNIIVFINGVAGGFLCLLHRYFVRLDFLRLRHIILDFLKNFSLFFGLGLAEIFEKIIGNVQFLAEEPITETGRQFIRNVNAVGINAQINELLKASIQSQGVISLFDPAVLDEISKMKEKNIAVEILKKLMAEQVSLYKRTNVVQSQKFSEKITQLMNSYYNGLITNEEVIKELLKTAQEITELYNNGKKLGLTQEELAFYDALTKPENIKDFYQNNELIELTRELTEMLRKNRTIDWQKKETARASMRKMVKHLLKKYKYPPEDYDTAISTVISQCEMWTDNMVV